MAYSAFFEEEACQAWYQLATGVSQLCKRDSFAYRDSARSSVEHPREAHRDSHSCNPREHAHKSWERFQGISCFAAGADQTERKSWRAQEYYGFHKEIGSKHR